MNKNKYPDYFTEYSLPNFINNEVKTNLNFRLHKYLASPLCDSTKYKSIKGIVLHIFKYFAVGKEHILFTKYQNIYGDNRMSTNFIIPFYDEYNNIITDMIVLCDPNDCMNIAKNHVNKSPYFKLFFTDSVISTTDVDHWKKQRSQMVMSFNPIFTLKNIIHISQKRSKKASKILLDLHYKKKNINIHDFFLNETQAQLQLALFGVNPEFEEKYNKKIRDGFKTLGDKGFIREIGLKIQENINNGKFNGPISKMLKDYNKETDTEVYGNILLLLFAGHDTTGHTLTWLIFELCKNMELQLKLQREIDMFWLNQGSKDIEIEDFKDINLLNLCISETLRLYPAVANGTFRQLSHDEYITGLKKKQILVPKGTYVQIPNFYRHRNPELWKDPLKFNPYRKFTEDEIWTDNKFNATNPESYRYSPFMYNSRSCLGKHFANIEMRLILLNLLKDYTFILSKGQKTENIEFNRMTMGPENGLFVNIIKRKSSI